LAGAVAGAVASAFAGAVAGAVAGVGVGASTAFFCAATGFSIATVFSGCVGFGVIVTGRVDSTDAGGAAGVAGFSSATAFSDDAGFGVVTTGRVDSTDTGGATGAAATVARVAALSTDAFAFVSCTSSARDGRTVTRTLHV
jgi:hypothetical protein